jgi:hypothetical protein
MRRLGVILMMVMVSSLFLTSCEKEYDCNPLSTGNGPQNDQTRDGEIVVDSNDDSEDDLGITDSGRDEDYDKSGKKKKP